jgi:phospholipase C
LPQVVYIDPHYFGNGANDDHPDHDIAMGQALIASVYAALAQSPQWNEVLFVITYDEHGGFFDHVPPPTTADDEAGFEQMGFRVPAVVAGPYVKRGCVIGTTFEHVSVLRTIQRRFGLTPFNARMEAANDLSPCIDPKFLGSPQPPAALPLVKVPMSRVFTPRDIPLTHPEIWDAAEDGTIPRHLDRRAEGEAIAHRVLEYGVSLGAVKLVPWPADPR